MPSARAGTAHGAAAKNAANKAKRRKSEGCALFSFHYLEVSLPAMPRLRTSRNIPAASRRNQMPAGDIDDDSRCENASARSQRLAVVFGRGMGFLAMLCGTFSEDALAMDAGN